MTVVIAGLGSQIRMIASVTFPAGATLNQFSDDSDAFDFPEIEVATASSGANGDLLKVNRAAPLLGTLSVPAGSDADILLTILLEANRGARGKKTANDVVTMTVLYPSGKQTTLTDGFITKGVPIDSMDSSSKLKSKIYSFAFENKTGTT